MQEKEAKAVQLQGELESYKQVASTPEQLLESLELATQIAKLDQRLQEAESEKIQAKLEREAAIEEVEAMLNFVVQLHVQLGKMLFA